MRFIALIEEPTVIEKILTHLGRWGVSAHNPLVAECPSSSIFPRLPS
jgi:hypothetical protein